MGMYLTVNYDRQPLLEMVDGAIIKLFNNPTDPFFTGRVWDILFDGVAVDCSDDDDTVKAICLNFEPEKAFRKVDDGHYAFSLFAGVRGNGSRGQQSNIRLMFTIQCWRFCQSLVSTKEFTPQKIFYNH